MAHSKQYIKLMNSVQWKHLRDEWLSDHPICEICYKDYDIVTPAQCVHHIVPVESKAARTDADMRRLAFSKSNLQSLCFACHSALHTAEQSHTKEAHKQREQDRLERWKARHTNHPQGD